MKPKKEPVVYRYEFKFANGVVKEFVVKLDNETLNLIDVENKIYSEWTKLEHFRCPNCSLDKEKYEYCPVAVNLNNIIEYFKDSLSCEMVDVVIESAGRSFSKHTSIQEGLNSIIGVCMVTSGCPVLEKLKPMICVRVPFSTLWERKYRVLTMYLLAQYFIQKRGGEPDWEFKNLIDIFEDVRIVNKNFCKKLSKVTAKDAAVNALISLDSFAFYTSFHISENMLNVLEYSFDAYLDKHERRSKARV